MGLKIDLVIFVMVQALLSSLALATDPIGPPRLPIQHLQSINLHRLLHNSHGILRIAVGGDDDDAVHAGFSDLRKRALGHLCDCPTFLSSATRHGAISFEEALNSHPKDLQQINLPDGTVRRTLASATVGFDDNEAGGGSQHATALELPSWVQDTCGQDAYNSFEDLRDVVADVVDMFVERLDQEKKSSNRGVLDVNGQEKDQSYRQILSEANHLEHFHVYTKPNNSGGGSKEGGVLQKNGGTRINDDESNDRISSDSEVSTLDYHTDAGFFLSFVPAMNCRSSKTDNSSFYLKAQKEPVTFEEDEIVIMLGAGAQYWLPSNDKNGSEEQSKHHPFLAASHALRLLPDTHRTWYGKMHLLHSSLTSSNTATDVKHGEALSSFQLKDYDAHVPSSPVDGCGTTVFNEKSASTVSLGTPKQSRRRLQHVGSPANCNNQTNFFCWYQCIDIPSSEQAEQYVQEGRSLYCLDPAKLSSSDSSIADATEPCKGGYIHNSNCKGSWQETDESIAGYKLPYEVEEKGPDGLILPVTDVSGEYCYGGTSMYMDGFNWLGTTCVIYLFQSWVLSTPEKFALAALGSILLGIALEFVLWKRRSVYTLSPGFHRLCLSAGVYVLQLTMGYIIMLVVMTYSAPLFISTVGGMMLGHVFFNAQDSLVKVRAEKKNRIDADEMVDANGSRSLSRAETVSNTEFGTFQNNGTADDALENGEGGDSTKSPPERENDKLDVTENTKLRGSFPSDGATPCCQYTM